MSQELNGTCAICGKKYHICNTCANQKTFVPWRTIVDSIECFKIYNIIHDYNYKYITKEDAKDALLNRKIPDTLQNNIRRAIEEIMKEEVAKGPVDKAVDPAVVGKEKPVEVQPEHITIVPKATVKKGKKVVDNNNE